MTRRHARATALVVGVALVLLCTACQDWAQFGGNAALTGDDSGETTISPANVTHVAQAFAIALPPGTAVVSTPIESGGSIYAGTSDGHLVAASAYTSSSCTAAAKACPLAWTAQLPSFDQTATPVVSGGVVYDTFLSTTLQQGELAAFDAAGTTNCSGTPKTCQPLWTASVVSVTGPNIDHGTLFVDSIPSSSGTAGGSVLAFDAAGVTNCSGTPKICQPLWSDATPSISEPTMWGGHVYVARFVTGLAGSSPGIDVYDEAGVTNCSGTPKICQPLWTVAIGGDGSVAISGGVGYVNGGGSRPLGGLAAFDANGVTNCAGAPLVCQPLWIAQGSGGVNTYTSAPAVAGGRVFFAGVDGLIAYHATATTCTGLPDSCSVWFGDSSVTELPTPVLTNGLVVAGNKIYDAAGITNCTPIDATHNQCSPLITLPVTSPSGAVVYNGTVYIGGSDSLIHAFRSASS